MIYALISMPKSYFGLRCATPRLDAAGGASLKGTFLYARRVSRCFHLMLPLRLCSPLSLMRPISEDAVADARWRQSPRHGDSFVTREIFSSGPSAAADHHHRRKH